MLRRGHRSTKTWNQGLVSEKHQIVKQLASRSSLSKPSIQLTMKVILIALLCSLAGLASAQFQFFEQMFNQGGQQQQHQQHQQQQQNVASDSEWYQRTYESGIVNLPS